ncbi:hypothetical protein Flavo103_41990, partial [Flavobacterium collinsii]
HQSFRCFCCRKLCKLRNLYQYLDCNGCMYQCIDCVYSNHYNSRHYSANMDYSSSRIGCDFAM